MTDHHLQPPHPPPPRRVGNARLTMAVAVAVTIALYFVPYGHHLAYPLVLVSTFVHEMGHGIAGVLVGGRFEEFVLYADASGRAQISGAASPLARAIVPAGGLMLIAKYWRCVVFLAVHSATSGPGRFVDRGGCHLGVVPVGDS